MSAVNTDLMLQEMLNKTAGKVNQVIYWSRPLDWHNQTLTPNPDAIYFMAFFNTKDAGPIVLEIPPAGDDGSLNGNIVDFWQVPLEDAGPSGADAGKGGKYLLLPPGYAGPVPEGYIVLRPATFGGYALLRSNLKSHSDADVAKSVAYGKRVKVYPLSQAANPPPTVFTDAANVVFDSTIRYDASFFTSLDRVVQSEPWLPRDRAMIDMLRSLGIEKGKPFNPDAKTKAALDAGGARGAGLARSQIRYGSSALLRRTAGGRSRQSPEMIAAVQADFNDPDKYPVDARGITYTYRVCRHQTPRHRPVLSGQPQRQGWQSVRRRQDLSTDGAGESAGRTILVGDGLRPRRRTRSSATCRGPAAPRRFPRCRKTPTARSTSTSGPRRRPARSANWVPTDPKRGFEVMFRAYAPTKAFFEKTWKLPDIERVN